MPVECDRDCWLFAKTYIFFFLGSHMPLDSSPAVKCCAGSVEGRQKRYVLLIGSTYEALHVQPHSLFSLWLLRRRQPPGQSWKLHIEDYRGSFRFGPWMITWRRAASPNYAPLRTAFWTYFWFKPLDMSGVILCTWTHWRTRFMFISLKICLGLFFSF